MWRVRGKTQDQGVCFVGPVHASAAWSHLLGPYEKIYEITRILGDRIRG